MSGFLLDTAVIIWAGDSPDRLSSASREALEEGPVFLSVIAYWEVVIKAAKGRLELGDPRLWWQRAVLNLRAGVLPLMPEHIHQLSQLPRLHQDPFDRVLVAQAMCERLTLLSPDRAVAAYGSAGCSIMR